MHCPQYELGYSFIGEFAGLVNQQHCVYIRHQFLLINPGNTLMPLWPSAAVSPGWLNELQPKGMKTKTNKATTKTTVHIEIETLFIMSPCYRPEPLFIIRVGQNTPLITSQLYKLPELLSTKNVTKWVRKYVKKKGFPYYIREIIIQKRKKMIIGFLMR